MAQNLEALRQAAVIYPSIAILFTLPYLAWSYRRYGSVFSLRILIVYSFILYMLCVYCLVILPLPHGDAANKLHGHSMQLIPLDFVRDMIRQADFSWRNPASWLALFTRGAFLSALLNLLMTVPFGIYMRYYFQCDLRKTIMLSFVLSLFFELTQLSGLYFIYPGSYRLFDMDDLLLNTLGGLVGYALAGPIARMLPSREALDQISLARGRQVSLLRRMLALFYDTVISLIAAAAETVFAGGRAFFWAIAAYFCVLPPLLSGRTPGMVWTRLRLCRKGGGIPYIYQYPVRFGLEFAALIGLPVALNVLAIRQYRGDNEAYLTLFLLMNGGYILALLFACVRALMHRPLFYERLSGTRLESTTENMNH